MKWRITEMLEWLTCLVSDIMCVHYQTCLSIIGVLESLIYRVWFNSQYLVSWLPIYINNIFVHHRHVVTFRLTDHCLDGICEHCRHVGMFSLSYLIQHVQFNVWFKTFVSILECSVWNVTLLEQFRRSSQHVWFQTQNLLSSPPWCHFWASYTVRFDTQNLVSCPP